MDGLSLAACVIAVIQLSGLCLKLSRKYLGPSAFGSSELTSMVTALYGFNGAVKSFQTHLEIYEDDEARLSSLEYLKPALTQCQEALHVIKDFVGKSSFVEKHVIGSRFNYKLKTSLKALDGAKELFVLTLHADQQTILHGVERYIRNVAEDVRDIHDVIKINETKLDGLDKEQNKYFKQADLWQGVATARLQKLREDGDIMHQEIKRVQREQENCERQAILDWITPINYALQQSDIITRRQEGTGKWLLESAEFHEWVQADKQILFCPGIPGAGKTILTAIVIEELINRFHEIKSVGMAYLYCNFRRKDDQNAHNLLASLLKQLSQERSSLPDSIKSLHDQHKDKRTRHSLGEILRALQSVVATYSRVFIIVDAIDECQISDGCRQRFLSSLLDLNAKSGVNLFVTSRPISSIEKEFNGKINLEIRASEEDVRQYLDGHMFGLPGFVIRSLELQEEIKANIVKVVDGMFLLAQLHLESLTGKRSPKVIRAALKALATGSEAYDQAYEDVMERINGQIKDQRELAQQVLWWITCAKRPLSTSELRYALTVEIGESHLDEDNLPDVEDIVSVCAGLVTVDKESSIIRLVHYTAQKYFDRSRARWFPTAETDIAVTCVTYLSFYEFKSGICRNDEDFEQRLQSNKLYDYASRNWGYHTREASILIPEVVTFLETKAQVEASSQALMAMKRWSGHIHYSQEIPKQMTGLHLAAYFGVDDAVRILLGSNNPDLKDNYGRTPLSWAANNGHEGTVRLLLDKGANIESKSNYAKTPLSWAIRSGHEVLVRLLLEKGANIESKSISGRTPLSWAARNGHEGIVRLLLDKGANIESKSDSGRTPLSWAGESGHEGTVQLLLERGANIESKSNSSWTSLWWAAESGHKGIVRLLLEKGADIESKDEYEQTTISWAAESGYEEIVRLLLEKGAEINSKDIDGRTPLSWATQNGHKGTVRLLLKMGAKSNSKDKYS